MIKSVKQIILLITICSWQFVLSLEETSQTSLVNNPVQSTKGQNNFSNPDKNDTKASKCFENLGCISSDGLFVTINDTNVALEFTKPEDMDVKFLLFTRKNPTKPQEFNYKSDKSAIAGSSFRASRKTKFIVHGWHDKFDQNGWTGKMKDYLLYYCDCNVFGVDWSKQAATINYFQSAADSRVVGKMIATLVNRLMDATKANPKNMHCVGHSLGAHVCAFAGQGLQKPKLDQISGLDPAGPLFKGDPATRLDPTDANLVVVMHTNAGIFTSGGIEISGFLGNSLNLGHFDFWINGGSHQPGCSITDFGCNHFRAHDYPTSRPKNGCQFIGYECDSYDTFEKGKCADCAPDNSKCKPMEFNLKFWDKFNRSQLSVTKPPKKNYYLKTSGSQPFCLFHYQIQVEIAKDSNQAEGKLQITLSPNKIVYFPQTESLREEPNVTEQVVFIAGTNYNQLYLDPDHLPQRENIYVKWTSFSKNTLKIERISFNYMSDLDKKKRRQRSRRYCPESGVNIKNDTTVRFKWC